MLIRDGHSSFDTIGSYTWHFLTIGLDITAIMGFFGLALLVFFLEETYPPIILVNKASELRRRTKNWGIHAKQEEIEVDIRELLEKNLSRPMRMLFTEPIVLALSICKSAEGTDAQVKAICVGQSSNSCLNVSC